MSPGTEESVCAGDIVGARGSGSARGGVAGDLCSAAMAQLLCSVVPDSRCGESPFLLVPVPLQDLAIGVGGWGLDGVGQSLTKKQF